MVTTNQKLVIDTEKKKKNQTRKESKHNTKIVKLQRATKEQKRNTKDPENNNKIEVYTQK